VPGRPARTDRVPLEEALPRAQLVTLHCPLTDATRWMVDRRFLAALPPGALLINTARGGLVDEEALREALLQGRLGGAGLDVLDREPPLSDHPLLDPGAPFAGRLIVTPHLAWATVEARARLVAESIANVEAWLRGERRNRVEGG
jgi:glycerate dehydrogenase